MKEIPKVSVCMTTYNNEKTFAKALESVLMQKVNFDYEIIIGDDASGDSTRDMLIEYYNMYPDRIRLILHKNNLGITKNKYTILKRARGEYLAFVDGDDYWTDEYKLQKQCDFLDNNKEYMGCITNYNIVDENDDVLVENKPAVDFLMRPYVFENNEITVRDCEKIMGGQPSSLNTLMFRNIYRGEGHRYRFLYQIHDMLEDAALYAFCVAHGKLYKLEDCAGAYRLVSKSGCSNGTSIWMTKNRRAERYAYELRVEKCMRKKFGCNIDLSDYRNNILIGSVCLWMKDKSKENFGVLKDIVRSSNAPLRTAYKMIKVMLIKKGYEKRGCEEQRITPEIISDKKRC